MVKEFIVNEQDKIVVNYNAFLGTAVISYNGKQAQKISKNTFKLADGEKTHIFNLRGGMFGGLSLDYEGKSFKVLDPISWYLETIIIYGILYSIIWLYRV